MKKTPGTVGSGGLLLCPDPVPTLNPAWTHLETRIGRRERGLPVRGLGPAKGPLVSGPRAPIGRGQTDGRSAAPCLGVAGRPSGPAGSVLDLADLLGRGQAGEVIGGAPGLEGGEPGLDLGLLAEILQ